MAGEGNNTQDKYLSAKHRLVVVWTWVGAIILAGVAIYVSGVLSLAIGIIIWTAIFVFILSGMVNGLERRGIKRVWGTTIAYVVLILVLGALLFIMSSPIFGIDTQFNELATSLPGYIQGLNDWATNFYNDHADVFQNSAV